MKTTKTYTIKKGYYIHDGYFISIAGVMYWTSINQFPRILKAV